MTQHQYIEQDSTERYSNGGRREHYGTGPGRAHGHEHVEEVALRIQVPGYGRARLSAVVPVETLSEIEAGDRPVEASLKIRVPGYGWRILPARVSPRDVEGAREEARSVRMRVPGCGSAPLRMTFPVRSPARTQTPEPKQRTGQHIGSGK